MSPVHPQAEITLVKRSPPPSSTSPTHFNELTFSPMGSKLRQYPNSGSLGPSRGDRQVPENELEIESNQVTPPARISLSIGSLQLFSFLRILLRPVIPRSISGSIGLSVGRSSAALRVSQISDIEETSRGDTSPALWIESHVTVDSSNAEIAHVQISPSPSSPSPPQFNELTLSSTGSTSPHSSTNSDSLGPLRSDPGQVPDDELEIESNQVTPPARIWLSIGSFQLFSFMKVLLLPVIHSSNPSSIGLIGGRSAAPRVSRSSDIEETPRGDTDPAPGTESHATVDSNNRPQGSLKNRTCEVLSGWVIPWFSEPGRTLRWIWLALHLLLFLVPSICISYASTKVREVDRSKEELISVLLVAIPQGFITVYSMGWLALTQRLSTHNDLQATQPLTDTHDIFNSWSGLGSALLCLWTQRKDEHHSRKPAFVTAYLLGIAALNVYTPSLLSIEWRIVEYRTEVRTSGIPDLRGYKFPSGPHRTYSPQGVVPFLRNINGSTGYVGLTVGALYEVLEKDNGLDGAVDIGKILIVTSNDSPAKGWIIETSTNTWTVPMIAPNMLRIQPGGFNHGIPANKWNIFIYTSSQFVDSENSTGSVVKLGPPTTLPHGPSPNEPDNRDLGTIHELQIMGCGISVTNDLVGIDAQTRKPSTQFGVVDSQKTSSTWNTWDPRLNQVLNETDPFDALVFNWAAMIDNAPLASYLVSEYCSMAMCGEPITVLEEFVMDSLALYPALKLSKDTTIPIQPNLTLHQLENVLANMTATTYWALTNIKPTGFQAAFHNDLHIPKPLMDSKVLTIYGHWVLCVNMNGISEMGDFSAAFCLLVIGLVLVMPAEERSQTEPKQDGKGFLQAIWLMHRHPALQTHIAEVDDPTEDKLRAAGRVNVCLSDY